MMRQAIAPRLAIKTLENAGGENTRVRFLSRR
jgi:hypothetical protein